MILAQLANHLWQSTLFAAVAGLLTLVLRQNRAQTRYCLWFAASVKFLMPFSLLVDVGGHFGRHTAPVIFAPGLSYIVDQASRPFAVAIPTAPMPAAPSSLPVNWIPAALFAVWTIGFVTLALSWWLRWLGLRAALRTASPLDLPIDIQAMTSAAFAEPGVFGIRRAVLLMPAGITDHLTPPQLEAIVAHELCHVRRRDNLATAVHMGVEALFWFHPLVWWLGARLMEERERACDEDVLRKGSEPETYAEGILKVCELYLESPLPFVAGAAGANLKKRIEHIMRNRTGLRLNAAKKAMLGVVGVAALSLPIAVGFVNAPVVRAQSTQSTTSVPPKFEVAAIKPCAPGDRPGSRSLFGGFPGRVVLGCVSVMTLINQSYVLYENGGLTLPGGRFVPIENGPKWIKSDLYTIEAKAEGDPSQGMMLGPMMQALLEERFKLKLHTETREVPVYELTVAKDGPKLHASQEHSCIPFDIEHPLPVPARGHPELPICKLARITDTGFELLGVTMAEFGVQLSARLGRDIIDKTGIAGTFDIRVPLTPDLAALATSPPPPPPGRPILPDASERSSDPAYFAQVVTKKLGLRLKSAAGPGTVQVIDHVEKPSKN